MNLKNRGNKGTAGASEKAKRGSRVHMQSVRSTVRHPRDGVAVLRDAVQRGRRATIIAWCIIVLAAATGSPLWAQAVPLSLDDAVRTALEKDVSVQSSSWDWLAASAKVEAAKWRQLPSVSFSAAYQRLSDVPAMSIDMADPFFGIVPGAPATVPFSLPASLDNVTSFALNMQYPVFAGFRVKEAMALAQLQAQSKLVGIEMVKRSLVFEVRRAYWEAVRATLNRQTLAKNLELMKASGQLTAHQVSQGTATRADQLAADMRYSQADLDLGDALSLQNRAFLVLASLIGNASVPLSLSPQAADAPAPFILTTQPTDTVVPDLDQPMAEADLVSRALAVRPETRVSSLSIQMAEHGIKQAQAGLYPTVTVLGNLTLADPNQRVPFQTDPTVFTGTWALGLQVGYDIGGLPATLKECAAQEQALKKTQADAEKQRNAVVLDVRTCIIGVERTRRDIALTRGAVDQAVENLRVAQQRLAAGTANDLDVLTAQFNLLKANFAVTNRQVDAQIAAADLARAVALDQVR
jgi:outer membrane protein